VTLLEALLATVILAVVAVACLEGTHGAATLQHRAASVSRALSHAEAVMATAATGGSARREDARLDEARVDVHRIPYGHGAASTVQRIEVSVRDADGRLVRLTRLVDHGQIVGSALPTAHPAGAER